MAHMSLQDVMKVVDIATSPAAMTKAAALEFLESLRDDINSRMEALRDEIAEQD